MPTVNTLSYEANQLVARIADLSDRYKIRPKYFAYFLDIGETHLYHMLADRPVWHPSDTWVQESNSLLDQLQPLLEEYHSWYTTKARSSKTAEGTFNRWLITEILRYRAEPLPQPPPEQPLHERVATLLGPRTYDGAAGNKTRGIRS